MAYDPDPRSSNMRDKAYPSEIASQRPALATRIHCREDYSSMDPRNSLRGVEPPEPPPPMDWTGENMCDRFNRQLRSGLGTSFPDNTDE